jgi:hypothetical protein
MTDYIWYVLTRAYWVTRWRLSRMRHRYFIWRNYTVHWRERRRLHQEHRDQGPS